ncbi:ATP-dependent DNA helicase RecG [Candidatus Saccharibacteria bacterium]|nr:ATP-dependent DNA helicase RecG [Candidatus Saccharibacteria bacterium]MCL1963187.1 ATP-dependent DNA helicase RecG [Candidatus Saccharibacteria bacterium]
MNLDTDLTEVKGVGAKTAEVLAAGGLTTVRDLVEFLPRKFEDFSVVTPIAKLTPGKVTIRARVESVSTRFIRRGMRITTAVFADNSGKVRAVWFNQSYREKQLSGNQEFFVSGEFALSNGRYQMTSPSVEAVKDLPVQTGRLLPIYPVRHGLKPAVTRKILNELRPFITMLPETLPAEIVTKFGLMPRADALLNTHFPDSTAVTNAARERLAFDELFGLILAAKLNKHENSRLNGFRIHFDQIAIKGFVDSLPFTMTAAQKRALWEILQDFDGKIAEPLPPRRSARPSLRGLSLTLSPSFDSRAEARFGSLEVSSDAKHFGLPTSCSVSEADETVSRSGQIHAISPMNRLLQGDVGSGKTVVAGAAAFQAGLIGFQTAFLAPTEILAVQHAETLTKLLSPFGVNVALLTGSVKGKNRVEILKQITNGVAHVIVGTHALLQPNIEFHKLGFVVIDEQHRFGVKQRRALLLKASDNVFCEDFSPSESETYIPDDTDRLVRKDGSAGCPAYDVSETDGSEKKILSDAARFMPHLLSMTATPIPRSLQLTVFGDLDMSILDQLPRGRKPIKTEIISPNSRAAMNAKIMAELANGRQAYFIAPLVEENEKLEQESVEKLAKKLMTQFKNYRIGILHGKMSANDKDKIMHDFADAKIDILVATTVVEVGVDVPNATAIVIENADRFGLAQLHQLRGRVGRGEHQSYCFLVQSDSKPPTRRLREVERSNDGFYLAEVDLKLRGAGEIYGTMQHGDLNLQIADISDTKLVKRASDAAEWFINSEQNLAHFPELSREINKYQKITTLN